MSVTPITMNHFFSQRVTVATLGLASVLTLLAGCVAVPQAPQTVANVHQSVPLQVIRYQPVSGGENYHYVPSTQPPSSTLVQPQQPTGETN